MEVEEGGGLKKSSSVLLDPLSHEIEAPVDIVRASDEDVDFQDNVMRKRSESWHPNLLIPGGNCFESGLKRKNLVLRIPKGGQQQQQANGPKRPVALFSHPYNSMAQNASSPTKITNNSSSVLGGTGRNNRRRSLPPNPSTPISSSLPSLASRASMGGEDWLIGGGGHHHPVKNSRKMRRYQKKLSNRLRRVTQAAPNNNNEFLMQEHDHLYHLDDEDSNSDEQHGGQHQHPVHQHRYSSSPEEDEEDFLARDFSNTYDVVHAERLFSMSKNQLIHEYQMMEERVELLENKLRSALIERGHCDGADAENDVNIDEDAEMFPLPRENCSTTSSPGSKSESIPVPNSTTHQHGHSENNHCNLSDSDLLISSSSSSYSANPYASHLSSSQSSVPTDDQDNLYGDNSADDI